MTQADGQAGLDPGDDPAGAPRIGPYRIVRLLGEGGMGRVWLAQQVHPRREVALKVVRGASANAIERMRREIEVLAQLEHPGIARLYAAGESRVDAVDVPWLALEYVRGTDLLAHAEAARLDLAARLRLVIAIGRAVEYAHARGVIHRDLKPANILVDDEGRPKILDFGIASMRDAGSGALTLAGQVLGTVPYMSPEQLEGAPIDVRADVYALGVIAYELVAGRLPHPRLAEATVFEALQILRDDVPPPLGRIAPAARGDLETVVMKALAGEPAQRYATVAAFVDDLERVLGHRPVAARRPGLAYRAGRFVRRHRALSAAVASVIVVLAATSVVSLRFALAEQRARAEAEQRAQEYAAVNAFLDSMLASADPEYTRGARVTVGEVIDRAEHDLDRLDAPARVQAAVASTLASTRQSLGEYDVALALNARALHAQPADAPAAERVRLLRQRTALLTELTRFDEARAALEQARAAWPEAPATVRLDLDLAAARIADDAGRQDEALHGYRAILAAAADVRPAATDAARAFATMLDVVRSNLSALLRERGELAESQALLREVLERRRAELGERAPATLASRHKLALVLAAQGDNATAAQEAEATLALQREVLGNAHAVTLTTMQTLANILVATGDLERAEALARESLAGFEAQFGDGHVQALAAMNTLAYLLDERRKVDEAEALYRRILAIQQREGATHPTSLAPHNNLAMLLLTAGRLDAAEREFVALLQASRRMVGADHAMTAIFMSNHGLCLARLGRLAEARAELESAHARLGTLLGPAHARTRAAAERLAEVYRRLGLGDKASALLAEAPA
ncbi:MAG: serine/threonine protein kinase [Rhodanobacteraceae bacterium]|jgi:hypothetical protein|nr:serine/threonine protein kinase [Rhodanobacteraceae bacterium]